MFDSDPDFKVAEAYQRGFACGIFWPDQWESHGEPGGPIAYDQQGYKENAAWRQGWEFGHHCKLTGKKFALEDPYLHMRSK